MNRWWHCIFLCCFVVLWSAVQNSTAPPIGHPSRSGGNLKIRSKNYASPDCGAKIVATNPEALYAGSIISPSRDEYVLNACANRFWFVVELCEAIQAKKVCINFSEVVFVIVTAV